MLYNYGVEWEFIVYSDITATECDIWQILKPLFCVSLDNEEKCLECLWLIRLLKVNPFSLAELQNNEVGLLSYRQIEWNREILFRHCGILDETRVVFYVFLAIVKNKTTINLSVLVILICCHSLQYVLSSWSQWRK